MYVRACVRASVCVALTVGSGQQQCRDENDEGGSHCVPDEDLQAIILVLLEAFNFSYLF